mgnify:CR=1 FL=1
MYPHIAELALTNDIKEFIFNEFSNLNKIDKEKHMENIDKLNDTVSSIDVSNTNFQQIFNKVDLEKIKIKEIREYLLIQRENISDFDLFKLLKAYLIIYNSHLFYGFYLYMDHIIIKEEINLTAQLILFESSLLF